MALPHGQGHLDFYFGKDSLPNMNPAYRGRPRIMNEIIKAAGGITPLAKALKVKKQAVSAWNKVPHGRVVKVSEITGIPREKIRPDLYA